MLATEQVSKKRKIQDKQLFASQCVQVVSYCIENEERGLTWCERRTKVCFMRMPVIGQLYRVSRLPSS